MSLETSEPIHKGDIELVNVEKWSESQEIKIIWILSSIVSL